MYWIVKVLILVLIVTVAAIWIIRKIRYGSSCCGEHEAAPAKVKVKDRNAKNYPYLYELSVDGMHCANCARRVENAFNSLDGFWASADIAGRKVKLLSKQEASEKECSKIISDAGYTLLTLSTIKDEEDI